MVKAYSEDLRKRVIAAKEKGQSSAVVARRFSLNVRSVERYWKRYQETALIAPKRHGGYRRSKLAPHDQELVTWIERQPDLTLAELQQRCDERLQITVSLHALWYRLDRIGLSRKKNDARRRARPA